MKLPGRRRCKDCGNRWSYYDTGTVACPACGSLRSVSDEAARQRHTDASVSLDLVEARTAADRRPIRSVAEDAADAARRYLTSRGFIRAGELLLLDEEYCAVAELRYAAAAIRRSLDVSVPQEEYFLALLAGADSGDRPEDLPRSMWSARGLAAADAVDAYRADLSTWLEDQPDPEAAVLKGRLRDHARRIGALDGDVPPSEADTLVAAARDLGSYLRDGEREAIARAAERLDRLG